MSIIWSRFYSLITCLTLLGKQRSTAPVSRGLDDSKTRGRGPPILACARIPGMEETKIVGTKMEETKPGQTKFEDAKLWVALSRVPQLGTVRFRRLESHFGKLENAWCASFNELKAAGLEDRPAQEILAARNNLSPDEEMAALERAGVTAVTWNEPGYPFRLKEIADPPAVL